MTLEEFEDVLDLYGASVADWPEAQRLGAATVLAQSTEAQAMLAAAEEVAALLAKTRPGPDAGGHSSEPDRIVAIATAVPQSRPVAKGVRLPGTGWRYAACVAVAVLGFALGVTDGLGQAVPFSPIMALAFGSLDPFDAL
jgi:hypothetical protein